MKIRRLDVSDAAAYRAFRLRGLREHPEAFTSDHDTESARPLADTEKRLGPQGDTRFWAALVDGQLAGVAGLTRETRVQNRHKATLVAMYVAPEFSGRHIGRTLVDAVIADARSLGIELLVLTVTAGNQLATALYERAGFAAFGIEPDAIRVNGVSLGKQHMYLVLAERGALPPAEAPLHRKNTRP